jgi:competence protein ComFB
LSPSDRNARGTVERAAGKVAVVAVKVGDAPVDHTPAGRRRREIPPVLVRFAAGGRTSMEILTRDGIDYSVAGHSLQDIVNYNEHLVLKALRQIYAADKSLCRCPICVEDAFALALNSLPPRYIQATSVQTYQESVNFVSEEQVRARVADATSKVQNRPNH